MRVKGLGLIQTIASALKAPQQGAWRRKSAGMVSLWGVGGCFSVTIWQKELLHKFSYITIKTEL